jgi:hypothetical protein
MFRALGGYEYRDTANKLVGFKITREQHPRLAELK